MSCCGSTTSSKITPAVTTPTAATAPVAAPAGTDVAAANGGGAVADAAQSQVQTQAQPPAPQTQAPQTSVPQSPIPAQGTGIRSYTDTGAADATAGANEIGTTPAPSPAPAPIDAGRPDLSGGAQQGSTVTGGGAPAGPADSAAAADRTPGWSPQWEKTFQELKLAPSDLQFLAQSNLSDEQLQGIATELAQQPVVDPNAVAQDAGGAAVDPSAGQVTSPDGSAPSPTPGVDAGSASSTPEGPSTNAWSPAWADKFSKLMEQQGLSKQEITQQLDAMKGQPVSQEQLEQVYDQMKGSIGAFDDKWKDKFTKLFAELKVPADQQAQALQGLSGQGLDEAGLQKAYDEMAGQKPAWSQKWEDKFKSLGVPDEMMKQLKESGAPEKNLQETLDRLVKTKMDYKNNGRLDKLEDAKASDDEKWSIMLSNPSDKDFDKAAEGIKSSHVPIWKRGLSIAVSLIPGVGTLQYLTGKDWITGEKIDRTNPLNIGMAILSAIPVATSIRGGIQAVKGAGLLTSALKAGTAGAATEQALKGAGILTKMSAGLGAFDKVKMVIPLVNKFGEAGKLFQAGTGFAKGTQFLAAFKTAELARKGIALPEGAKFTQESLNAMGKAGTLTGTQVRDASKILKDVSAMGKNTSFVQKASVWRFNPFSNKATVEGTRMLDKAGDYTKVALGRGVNPRSAAGMAQIKGTISATKVAALDASSAFTQNAIRTTAGEFAGVVDKIGLQKAAIANWGTKLGVGQGGAFRSLVQVGQSNRAVTGALRAAKYADSTGYQIASKVGGFAMRNMVGPTAGMVVAGTVVGQSGKAVQPIWEAYKNRDEIKAQDKKATADADTEQKALQQQYEEMQTRQGAAGGNTPAGDATGGGAPATNGGAATATPGNEDVQVDPKTGFYIDPETGLQADPATGNVYDPTTGKVVGTLQGGPGAEPNPPAGNAGNAGNVGNPGAGANAPADQTTGMVPAA